MYSWGMKYGFATKSRVKFVQSMSISGLSTLIHFDVQICVQSEIYFSLVNRQNEEVYSDLEVGCPRGSFFSLSPGKLPEIV